MINAILIAIGLFAVLCLITVFNFVLKYFDQAKMYNRISRDSYQHNRRREEG